MSREWKPRNLGGTIHYDPKGELEYWIARAENDPMVAVPVVTLRACLERRECKDSMVVNADEDGQIDEVTIYCRLDVAHTERGIPHYNGYYTWSIKDN